MSVAERHHETRSDAAADDGADGRATEKEGIPNLARPRRGDGAAAGALRAREGGRPGAGEICLNWHQAQTEEEAAAAAAIFLTDNTTTVSHLALGDPIFERC